MIAHRLQPGAPHPRHISILPRTPNLISSTMRPIMRAQLPHTFCLDPNLRAPLPCRRFFDQSSTAHPHQSCRQASFESHRPINWWLNAKGSNFTCLERGSPKRGWITLKGKSRSVAGMTHPMGACHVARYRASLVDKFLPRHPSGIII